MIVLSESAVVFDQRSADKGVIADTIAANPRIEETQGVKRRIKRRIKALALMYRIWYTPST